MDIIISLINNNMENNKSHYVFIGLVHFQLDVTSSAHLTLLELKDFKLHYVKYFIKVLFLQNFHFKTYQCWCVDKEVYKNYCSTCLLPLVVI